MTGVPSRRGSRSRCGTGRRAGRSRRRAAAATGARRRSGDRAGGPSRRATVAGPATPSAARPAHAWKRVSAAAKCVPASAVEDTGGEARAGEEGLERPRRPSRACRTSPRGRRGPAVRASPSARRVAGPATPSTASPACRWTARTPAVVAGPATPSTLPAYTPRARSATCSAATSPVSAAAAGAAVTASATATAAVSFLTGDTTPMRRRSRSLVRAPADSGDPERTGRDRAGAANEGTGRSCAAGSTRSPTRETGAAPSCPDPHIGRGAARPHRTDVRPAPQPARRSRPPVAAEVRSPGPHDRPLPHPGTRGPRPCTAI